jgi:hypothetical protein
MSRVFCALLALLGLCCVAFAKQATLGAASLTPPPPAGYCEMDEAQPSDARMIGAVSAALERGPTRLLAISADCRQLEDWRAERRPLLGNYAQYHTLKAWENTALPAAPAEVIKQTCAALRAQGEDLLAKIGPDIRARVEQAMKDVKYNEMKFMGVVGEDTNACYASMLQRLRAETGADVEQVTVFAATIVKAKLVYYYLYAPFLSGQTVNEMLAQLRLNVAALQAANRN